MSKDFKDDNYSQYGSDVPIGFGSHSKSDDEAELNEEQEQQKKERNTVLFRKRAEKKQRRFIFFLLLGVTLFIALLNFVKIQKTESIDRGLVIKMNSALAKSVDYSVDFTWTDVPEGAEVFPVILLGDARLPTRVTCLSRQVDPQSRSLGIKVPQMVLNGGYSGFLSFMPLGGSGNPKEIQFNVLIQVPSIWAQWGLLLGWLTLLLFLLFLLYLVNFYWNPAPQGFIRCSHFVNGIKSQEDDYFSLHSSWSWLWAAKRSEVSLSRQLEKRYWAKPLDLRGISGITLEFERMGISYGVSVRLNFGSAPEEVKVYYQKPNNKFDEPNRPMPLRDRLVMGGRSDWYLVEIEDDWFSFQIDLSTIHGT